jgi:hypothetical protein
MPRAVPRGVPSTSVMNRGDVMRRLVAGLVMVALLVPGAARAQDDCDTRLANIPLEAIALPDGYSWETAAPFFGGWLLTIERDAGTADFNPSMNVVIGCATDPVAWVQRLEGASLALDIAEKVAVAVIGDATLALRSDGSTSPNILFARGPFLVTVTGAINQGDMEAVARSVDAVLSSLP